MARSMFVSLALVSLSLAVGCGKGKDKEGGAGGTGGGGGGAPAKVAGPTALPKAGGLSIDLPGEKDNIMVSDGIAGKGHLINTVPTGGITVELEDAQPTLDDAKKDAEMFNAKNLKDEKLADGFVVTFDNTGSMGANYFVEVHRTIDGKNVHCAGTSDSAAKAAAALAACKSIHK